MQRNPTLDFIRGLAVLGILLLNIVAFGLPSAAYLNPAWQGTITSREALDLAVMDGLGQLKFLSLFALLFGAGLYQQLPRGGRWLQARISWLLLFGALHTALFWDGDILLDYGLVGLVARRAVRDAPSSRSLLHSGIFLYLIGVAVLLIFGLISDSQPGRSWLPGPADTQYELYWKTHLSWEAVGNRLDQLASGLLALAAQYGWQLAGVMMAGAALMQNGWLQGQFSQAHYWRCALAGIGLGALISLPGIVGQWLVGWSFRWSAFYLQIPRELGCLPMSLGYAALCFAIWPRIARSRLAYAVCCVGRMALTCYLLQTLICTTLFYRFDLFMRFDRWQLLAFIPPIWLVCLLFSCCWLSRFQQGPLEWAWRRLTQLSAGKPALR